MELLNSLPFNGYKTGIFFVAGVVLAGLHQLGYVEAGLFNVLWTWIELGFGGALAHKIAKR